MTLQTLEALDGTTIYYQGLGPEAGPLPALFYFALSGEESLTLHPFNQPAVFIDDPQLRVFSFTLPGHGEGFDKHHAMEYWAKQIHAGEYLIESFLERVMRSIAWLIESDLIDVEHMATAGLSRGGFIATHVAARHEKIHTLLAFAPLTTLDTLQEFQGDRRFKERRDALSLVSCIERLTHLRHLRFYIGNHDTRVSTDACYHFIRQLATKVHENRVRHCHVELFITPSIGHKGHGTSPHIFEEGTLWLKQHLLKG